MSKHKPRKGVRSRPRLTEDNVEDFLDAALRTTFRQTKLPPPGYWLIFRLIIEHGLRTGEIVGTQRKNRPGIQYSDLKENSIWIHSKLPGEKRFYFHHERLGKKDYFPVPVSTGLLRQIRKYADTNRLTGKIFDIHEDYVRKLTRRFAEVAKIPQWDLVNPETLRDGFRKYSVPPFDLGVFEAKMLRRAETMAQYYMATFCIEKDLREVTAERMRQTYGVKWWEEKIDPELQAKIRDNQKQERETLMFVRSDNPLEYTTLIELMSIVEQYWAVFSNDFLRGLSRLKESVNTLNQLRHVVAHNSELTDEQKKKFEVLMDDWRGMQLKP